MANVWFCSDFHIGHKNIHKYRTQFSSEEEHRAIVKENYHRVVTKRDKVFIMGDSAFTLEALKDVSSWVGTKVLICGNHDVERVSMREVVKYYDEVYALYKYKSMWLSHAPIHPDELRGKYNVHGHCHNFVVDDPRYLNVCMEHINFTPIDLNEVRRRLGMDTYL